jgi:gliding motility-associated-like protein
VSYELTGSIENPILNVLVQGMGNYIYSINHGPFQQSPVFENLTLGEHVLMVNDKNGCGTTTITVYVLGFPNFFTPNNDGYHDTWQIAGQNPDTPQLQRIEIYDRFSKLLYILNKNTSGWTGTYNGKQMPSSDYWFKAIFKNGSTYRGHFTLKR